MDSPLVTAQHYSNLAGKMRRLAAAVDDEKQRASLIDIASGYERLAEKYVNIERKSTQKQKTGRRFGY